MRDQTIHLGQSATPKSLKITNCGRDEAQETPVKPTKKLTRVAFPVSRLMEFCHRRELETQTGHTVDEWPLVVLKELLDNALDACEEAEVAPVISIAVKGDTISIKDNGPGIPAKTIDGVLNYNIRVSSREAYVSPTRGAQGNALKTILPMAYVLDKPRGEDACGKTIIEAHGVAHHIAFSVDHIKQCPLITLTTKPSSVVRGTRITVNLPADGRAVTVADSEEEFLQLAERFTWFNPHLSLRVSWNGERRIDIKASNPNWYKWLPSWPTSAHWYDVSRLRRYMAAHIANRDDITVREFISEFRGLTGTAKQKLVLAQTGASHRSLHDFFGIHKANTKNIAKLLEAVKQHSKPVRPAELGIIGKEHLFARMEAAGGDPKTFEYHPRLGEMGGLPHVVEFAFGAHSKGLTNAARVPRRKEITGVNWSAGIKNPFRQLGRSGASFDSALAKYRANTDEPVIVVLHVATPRAVYTDRGKSAIVVEGEIQEDNNNGEE
jgi:DNA topoisomerase VI subunit B